MAAVQLRDAIATYNDLLTDELAAESQAQLDDQLRRRGLFFGGRALCTVLRPRLFSPEQYRTLQRCVPLILRAFSAAYRAALERDDVRAQFGLTDWEEELWRLEPGFRASSPTGRLDMFFDHDRDQLSVVEFNAETPAGQAYTDVLTEVFYGLPVMREFARRYELRPLPARPGALYALLGAHQQWVGVSNRANGAPAQPRIAILDWREVPTYSEFTLFAEYARSQGLDCVIADPRAVEYRDGALLVEGAPAPLIYKRVLLSELVDRGGLDHPVIRAVREGAVCMVNPFRCKLLHKKASLAVLSDERNAGLFSPAERETIAAHIPWTRRVEERRTVYRGQVIDLLPYCAEHREQLVLKANDEYGGKGIVLGWETEPAAWEQALRVALTAPFVVQERVGVPTEPYPSLVDGRVELIERFVDTDPFIRDGEYMDGCLTRLSTAALLNVTAGGGSTVPAFVVEPR